ncbi:hypothetical protein K438DRAFT_1864266, partial [Mycena galopus ATCC 62051]
LTRDFSFLPCSVIFPSSSVAYAWSPSQRPSPEGRRPNADAPRSQGAVRNQAYNPPMPYASPIPTPLGRKYKTRPQDRERWGTRGVRGEKKEEAGGRTGSRAEDERAQRGRAESGERTRINHHLRAPRPSAPAAYECVGMTAASRSPPSPSPDNKRYAAAHDSRALRTTRRRSQQPTSRAGASAHSRPLPSWQHLLLKHDTRPQAAACRAGCVLIQASARQGGEHWV